jgi:hypothetical protein
MDTSVAQVSRFEEVPVPPAPSPDRLAPIQFLPRTWGGVPVVVPYPFIWVAGGVEEPRYLLTVGGPGPIPALSTMAAKA